MNITQIPVESYRLTELHRLDPITIHLEDFGDFSGRLTIECFSESWSSYWGAMGCSLIDFLIKINDDYLFDRLTMGMRYKKEKSAYVLRIVQSVKMAAPAIKKLKLETNSVKIKNNEQINDIQSRAIRETY